MKPGVGLLLLTALAASPEARYFRYERPVQSVPQQGGQTCFALDPETFAHSAPELADLRLYRGGSETPFVIRTAALAESVQKSIEPLNLGSRAGQTVFDAELPDIHYSDLQLDIGAQDFIATVTVTGGRAKNANAETRLGAYTIFDLTRQRLGRSTVLHLPQSDFPYLHFRIAGPLLPNSIRGLSVDRLPGGLPAYLTIAETSQVKQKGHSSIVEFIIPAHVPVEQIAFTPGASSALFYRSVSISVAPAPSTPLKEGVEPPQSVLTTADLLRIHSVQNGHRIDEERLTIDAPNVDFDTSARWTITIDNGDDTPLTLASVRLQALERSLCFEAAANNSYTLYYGDVALAAPRYDYATLFAAQTNAGKAKEGPEQVNAAWQPRPDQRPFTEKHPALLWIALVAVVALLGIVAVRSAKRPA